MAKPSEIKGMAMEISYPVNMDTERISLVKQETAEVISRKFREELEEKIGPNWFEVASGWIHQPGVYRLDVKFTINMELVHGY
jgi:hypothetical protein